MTADAEPKRNLASSFSRSAKRTIEIELSAVEDLLGRVDVNFERACEILLACRGRIVVTGMGKSGHIARKIAATLASTGSLAMYLHPGEASHGDIGMIDSDDVVLALSNSGNTEEITALLPVIKRKGIPLITLTGAPDSPLAVAATVSLDVSVNEEACPLGLAPTSSTTASLVFGDALAMALLEARGFTREDFALSHPGGNLGRRLLLLVKDIMHEGDQLPVVAEQDFLSTALLEMTNKGFGLTTIQTTEGSVVGVFSDGDLRRSLDSGLDLRTTRISEVMSREFKYVKPDALAAEAARIMQESNVYVLIVSSDGGTAQGIIKMHDLLEANVV